MAESNLSRFLGAQAEIYPHALAELRAGEKTSHWMWFVFPQIAGLGHSPTAQFYAIRDLAEARGYLADPVLGPRLDEALDAVLSHAGHRSAEQMLGPIDAAKLRSCCTLFEVAAGRGDTRFAACLDAFFGGVRDPETLRRL